jgi:hypothetical protein
VRPSDPPRVSDAEHRPERAERHAEQDSATGGSVPRQGSARRAKHRASVEEVSMRLIRHCLSRYPAIVLTTVVGLGFVGAVLMMRFPALRGLGVLD